MPLKSIPKCDGAAPHSPSSLSMRLTHTQAKEREDFIYLDAFLTLALHVRGGKGVSKIPAISEFEILQYLSLQLASEKLGLFSGDILLLAQGILQVTPAGEFIQPVVYNLEDLAWAKFAWIRNDNIHTVVGVVIYKSDLNLFPTGYVLIIL